MEQIIINIMIKEIAKKMIITNIQNIHKKMNIMKKFEIIITMINIIKEDKIKMIIIIIINSFPTNKNLRMIIEIKIFINLKGGMDLTFSLPKQKENCKSRLNYFKKRMDNFL
jgi:hypothetical protein